MKNLMNQVGKGYGRETDLERGNYILCVQLNSVNISWGSGGGVDYLIIHPWNQLVIHCYRHHVVSI